jgi:hypothetical protein
MGKKNSVAKQIFKTSYRVHGENYFYKNLSSAKYSKGFSLLDIYSG